jgi:hypothetical protein
VEARPLSPFDAELLAGVGEKPADVIGPVRELVTGIGRSPAFDVHAVEATPAIGMDKTSQKG